MKCVPKQIQRQLGIFKMKTEIIKKKNGRVEDQPLKVPDPPYTYTTHTQLFTCILNIM